MAISMFRVDKNGTAQNGLANLTYTKLTWARALINDGSYFDLANGVYRPPTGARIWLSANVWAGANCKSPNNSPYEGYNFTIKIIKNNGVYDQNGVTWDQAGVGWEPAGYTNTAGACIGGFADVVTDGDYYDLRAYTTSTDGTNIVEVDGNPAHTAWSGMCFT